MSSRVLKKLQGNGLELQQKNTQNADNDEDDGDQPKQQIKNENAKHQNIFELLNQQSLSDSESKDDSNESEQTPQTNVPNSASNAAKKRKRKKKAKSKIYYSKDEKNEGANKYFGHKDPLLNKVSKAAKQNEKLDTSLPTEMKNKFLLAVELKHLNPENEMRRTFGKKVVKRDKRLRPKTTLKSAYIISAKETWPPVNKNIISMKLTTPPESQLAASSQSVLNNGENSIVDHNKLQWFEFEHSQQYQNIQNMFLSALERTDSDFLINLIWRCPHHVDSLIQLSELCKMTEDFSLAAELIERAVLVLETSLHPSFSLTNGNSRLDYKRQRNRAFFIALFKHAQYLEARACCRTAFEISKLILNLNPEVDPLAMVLIIDYYALRSKQYKWLIDFYEEYDAIRNLSQLPNMAYSYALALFCQQGETEASDGALQYALLMFPGVLRPLLDELSVQTDKRVLGTSYFNSEICNNQAPALHQLVCLYICRAKNIWRQNNILQWLERNVNTALDRIDNKEDIVQEYRTKRSTRYLQPPRPVLRHVILSDFKEKVPIAPFVVNEQDAIITYDPLPPIDSIDFYKRKTNTNIPAPTGSSGQVSRFFRSLLPSFHTINSTRQQQRQPSPQQPQQQQEQPREQQQTEPTDANTEEAETHTTELIDNNMPVRRNENLNLNLENTTTEVNQAPNEANAGCRELTQSINDVVEAMRHFLQYVRIGEVDQVEYDGNDSNDDDSTNDYVE